MVDLLISSNVFVINDHIFRHPGGRQSEDIVAWLLKKTGPPAKDISTIEIAKEFIEASNVVVLGFFKDQTTDLAKAFLEVAAGVDDIPFGISSDDGVLGEYEAKTGTIVLLKKVKKYFNYLYLDFFLLGSRKNLISPQVNKHF